jgi:RNA polymerase sigma factor (sigma-70 family)
MQLSRSYSDAEVINDLKQVTRMNDALRFMYSEYYGLLESYIINNKGNNDDAADVIQETMVAFVEIVQQEKFRGESTIKSFLYAITRNLWLTELRKRSSSENRNRIFEKAKEDSEQATVFHLIKHEHFKTIQKLFEKLGEKCKQLLTLVYYEDLSMNDIIKQMPGYENEQVLRNKKYKCMKQLEKMMNADEQLKTDFKNALKNA